VAAKAATPAPAVAEAPATPKAAAVDSLSAVGSSAATPFVGAASVSAILSEPEEPLSPEALPAPVAASPARTARAAASPLPQPLSPLPAAAVHALPFVPRSSPAALSKAVPPAPASPSLNSLRKAVKAAMIEQRGRWPVEQVAAVSPQRSAPWGRAELPSVVVAAVPQQKPSWANVAAAKPAKKASHDLVGIPAGCVLLAYAVGGAHLRREPGRAPAAATPRWTLGSGCFSLSFRRT
jgi:hypothetical protein